MVALIKISLFLVVFIASTIQTQGSWIPLERKVNSKVKKAELIVPVKEMGSASKKMLQTLDPDRAIVVGIGNEATVQFTSNGVYFNEGHSAEISSDKIKNDQAALYPATKKQGMKGVSGVICYYIPDAYRSLCVLFVVPFDDEVTNSWNVGQYDGDRKASYGIYNELLYGRMVADNTYNQLKLGYGFAVKNGVMTTDKRASLLVTITRD